MQKEYPKFQKVKVSNSVVVGGMIAFGKSTLVEAIKSQLECNIILELDKDDELCNFLLNKMYQRENNELYGPLFQLYFVLNRFNIYKQNCNKEKLTIFDRSIFEDWLFAHENITSPAVFNYYEAMWSAICSDLVYNEGIPKLYVILNGTWELFKERIYKRNRSSEIENFQKNEVYFKRMLETYKSYMINICKEYGIKYLLLDANDPLELKVKQVLEELEKNNL